MNDVNPENHFPQTPLGHTKQRRAVIMTLVLFILLVAGMFVFTFLKQNEINNEEPISTQDQVSVDPYREITRIDGKHFFINGVHTIVGEIAMPTPCDLLTSGAIVAESMPEQVTLDFKVINNAETCPQVVTAQRFKVEVKASEKANFKALFQNRVVDLNLTPAAPGETPEEFELFIKG